MAQLGISNNEVARRCGLEERRYGHYASGRREPDLATLVHIASVLETSPNWLLGLDPSGGRASVRSTLVDRLTTAAGAMTDKQLKLFVLQAEAVARAGERQ